MLPALFLAILAMLANPCSADVVQYIVYPVHGISPEGSKALESLLISLAGNEKLVYASTRFYQPTPAYWLAKLSEPASIEVENSPLVRAKRSKLLAPKLIYSRSETYVLMSRSWMSRRR